MTRVCLLMLDLIFSIGWLLACEPCADRMLRSPLWTGATHVVQLRPIRIEQRGREPAPSPSRRPQDPPRSGTREQHSRDIRIRECTHFGISSPRKPCSLLLAAVAIQ